jgi:hypothetical protein
MVTEIQEVVLKRVESILREAEGCANHCLAGPARERGLNLEVMALAIQEALATIRSARS